MQFTESEPIHDDEKSEATDEIQKLTFHRADRSMAELKRLKEKGRLIIRPIWQRNFVWNRKQSSLLIESFLIDMPIPVIYLALNSENKYEVVDGQQRLTSVFNFIDGELELTGLEVRNDLNGCRYEDLQEHLQDKLTDSTITSIELSADTPRVAMRSMFERLNTKGTRLNAMEIRNCVYQGGLNDLIRELAENRDFKECVNTPKLSTRMKDRELVLRFMAFYQLSYNRAKRGLKSFFDRFYDAFQNPKEEIISEYRAQFTKAIKASYTIFGDRGFRVDPEKSRGFKPAIFQVMMVSFTDYDLGLLTRSADSIFEEYLDLLQTDSHWVECVTNFPDDYDRISYAFDTWKERLKEAVKNAEPNDSQRCFSRAEKEAMFDRSDFCEICGQKISHINDATLDHDRHWWRGGKTVLENARLVHRHCNATRPN